MRNFLILCCLMVLPSTTFANDQVCNDLQKLTCAPGDYNDGTGSASNPTSSKNNNTKLENQIVNFTREKFTKALSDPDNSFFRKAVLSATGLSLSPHCAGAAEKPSPNCLNDMAVGVTEIYTKQNSSQISTSTGIGSVSDVAYVIDSPIFKEIADQSLKKTKQTVGSDEVDKKAAEKLFPQIRALLIKKLDELPIDNDKRKQLIEKVRAIRYTNQDCSGGATSVAQVLRANAHYSPTKNTFTYCSGFAVVNRSEFNMAFVIAHELGHSIDPCQITMGPSDFAFKYPVTTSREEAEAAYPVKGVISCLRSDQSVRAAPGFQSQEMGKGYGMGGTYADMKPTQPAAPKNFSAFCQNDQIGEAVSDWIAAEITPEYISKNFPSLSKDQIRIGYSNIWRGVCADAASEVIMPPGGFGMDVHPAQHLRTNKVILAQPKIRKQMGCPIPPPSGTEYCDAVKAVQATSNPSVKDLKQEIDTLKKKEKEKAAQ